MSITGETFRLSGQYKCGKLTKTTRGEIRNDKSFQVVCRLE